MVSPVPLHLQQDVVEAVPSKSIASSSVKNDKDIFAELKAMRQPDLSGFELAKPKKKKK